MVDLTLLDPNIVTLSIGLATNTKMLQYSDIPYPNDALIAVSAGIPAVKGHNG